MSESCVQPDSAGVLACALSLWREYEKLLASAERPNFSECYKGIDELMRVVMRVAVQFETWACQHIAFDDYDDIWPYAMGDRFGAECMGLLGPMALDAFSDMDCLRIALKLRLPVKVADGLPVPVKVSAINPVGGSAFCGFQIVTVRESQDGCENFTADDNPYDNNYDPPYFAIFGVGRDRRREHIADFRTYATAVGVMRKLVPGIAFPDTPHS